MFSAEACYRRYLSGDDTGMTELIREYKDPLTMYLFGVTGNIFTAEECMEQTFYKLVVKKPAFSGKSSFKTWLYAIGRNAALDHMRRNLRETAAPLDERRYRFEVECVEDACCFEQKRRLVHAALQKLNPDYRQALYLVYFEDMTAEETGRVMKKSRKQAENLISRGRAALKKELEKEGFGYEDL